VKRLRNFELKTLAYDPFITPAEAEDLQIELTGLEALFTRSDVVSIHTPWLKETEGLITSDLLSSLKPGATFINTSRGAVVDEHGLLQVARQRPDLTFLLDVTHPEPPPSDSPIYDLPNIILTPHIAGSAGGEVARMGEWMAEEFDRYRQGLPLRHEVTRGMLATMA
jgi:phosphoglycerate dehydrogenase-like enzyme